MIQFKENALVMEKTVRAFTERNLRTKFAMKMTMCHYLAFLIENGLLGKLTNVTHVANQFETLQYDLNYITGI